MDNGTNTILLQKVVKSITFATAYQNREQVIGILLIR